MIQRFTICSDHHIDHCRFCHDIVEQCACYPNAFTKHATHDGICGPCRAQVAQIVVQLGGIAIVEDRDPGDEDPRPSTF